MRTHKFMQPNMHDLQEVFLTCYSAMCTLWYGSKLLSKKHIERKRHYLLVHLSFAYASRLRCQHQNLLHYANLESMHESDCYKILRKIGLFWRNADWIGASFKRDAKQLEFLWTKFMFLRPLRYVGTHCLISTKHFG